MFIFYFKGSSRAATPASSRKRGHKEEEEDVTKDLPDPPAVPLIEEVAVPKHVRTYSYKLLQDLSIFIVLDFSHKVLF